MLLVLAALSLAALASLGFVSTAPNRLADGVAVTIWQAPALLMMLSLLPPVLLAGTSLLCPSRIANWTAFLLAACFLLVLLVAAAMLARLLVVPGHAAQRHALGAAFWCAFTLAGLMALDAVQRLKLRLVTCAVLLLALVGTCVALAWSGLFEALSLTRELASHRALFFTALTRHVVLVGAALLLSLLACVPLVLFVRRRPRQAGAVYAALGLVQTIPSIALFGLLITPLTSLAARVPFLKALGVSGLGATPALIALVLYAAFPLVRMSDAAFSAVAPEVADAAEGLGFDRRQRFFAVDLPLALPVLLSGLRVVTLQSIGLATVAALIGGGGLGTFIFEGIGEYALDLVLVGAIPVILLALAADFGFRLLQTAVAVPA